MNYKPTRIILLLFTVTFFIIIAHYFTTQNSPISHHEIVVNPDVIANLNFDSSSKLLLVDLRDDDDFKQKHIDGAINLPFNDDGTLLLWYLTKQNLKNKRIYLMCYSGSRSAKAFNLLSQNNFTKLSYVRFGFAEFESLVGERGTYTIGACLCKED